jgi:hypothetical protein
MMIKRDELDRRIFDKKHQQQINKYRLEMEQAGQPFTMPASQSLSPQKSHASL